MKYNEREYYQHQCDSVKVNVKIRCNEYFFISFPMAWRSVVIPRTWYSNSVIRHHFSQFPFECKKKKKKKKSFPFVAKNATGQRSDCHAVVLSCAIKHFYFQKLRGYSIMLGFMDLMWPRVFRRSNVGLVFYASLYNRTLMVDTTYHANKSLPGMKKYLIMLHVNFLKFFKLCWICIWNDKSTS